MSPSHFVLSCCLVGKASDHSCSRRGRYHAFFPPLTLALFSKLEGLLLNLALMPCDSSSSPHSYVSVFRLNEPEVAVSSSPPKKRKKRRSSKSGKSQRPRSSGSIGPSSVAIVDGAGGMQDSVTVKEVVLELPSVVKPPVKKARTVRGMFILF